MANLFKHFPGWTRAAAFNVLKSLSDSLVDVGAGGDVQQALIGLRILHPCFRLTSHRKYNRLSVLSELFHELRRISAKSW